MGLYDYHKTKMGLYGSSVNDVIKNNSNLIMEQSWETDVQSKICYIYDFTHDDSPDKNKKITHFNTIKKRIDAKFIVSSYGSFDKDQVAYHLMFKPSQPLSFNEGDDLFYFEKEYAGKYHTQFPVGLYIDIPNEKDIYERWLICDYEESNQFMKYVILPCDYKFQWVSLKNGKLQRNSIWGCTRSQSSYDSGLWIDRYFNSQNDVTKIILPLNSCTQSLHYVREDGSNQRVILSARTDNPLAWQISKMENTKPIGIIRITLKQDVFNPSTDTIDEDGMWANDIFPVSQTDSPTGPDSFVCTLTSITNTIQLNGKYKTVTASFTNAEGEDVSDVFNSISKTWLYSIDGENVIDFIDEKTENNEVKIIFSGRKYIGKTLLVTCKTPHTEYSLPLKITS